MTVRTRRRRWHGLAVLAAIGTCAAAFAAGGDFDPAFGTGGIATVPVLGGQAVETLVQSDGKALVAGSGAQWRITRFTTDGAVDASFGSGGSAVLFASAESPVLQAMALDGDDVVAGGRTVQVVRRKSVAQATVARWTSTGTLDTTFGSGGKVFLSVPNCGDPVVVSLAVRADHAVLVAGNALVSKKGASQRTWFLARLLGNGALDPTFGSSGIVVYDPTTQDDSPWRHALALLPDGSIVAGGYTHPVGGSITPDTYSSVVVFSASGAVKASAARSSSVYPSLAVDASGRIVVTARRFLAPGTYDAVFSRYLWNGTSLALDTEFGTSGETAVAVPGFDRFACMTGVAIDATGRIVAAGAAVPADGAAYQGWAFRLDANGLRDATFGTSGLAGPIDVHGLNLPQGAAIDGFGRSLVGGYAQDSGPGGATDWFVARFLAD